MDKKIGFCLLTIGKLRFELVETKTEIFHELESELREPEREVREPESVRTRERQR